MKTTPALEMLRVEEKMFERSLATVRERIQQEELKLAEALKLADIERNKNLDAVQAIKTRMLARIQQAERTAFLRGISQNPFYRPEARPDPTSNPRRVNSGDPGCLHKYHVYNKGGQWRNKCLYCPREIITS